MKYGVLSSVGYFNVGEGPVDISFAGINKDAASAAGTEWVCPPATTTRLDPCQSVEAASTGHNHHGTRLL